MGDGPVRRKSKAKAAPPPDAPPPGLMPAGTPGRPWWVLTQACQRSSNPAVFRAAFKLSSTPTFKLSRTSEGGIHHSGSLIQ